MKKIILPVCNSIEELLECEPPAELIQKHPQIKDHLYVPIGACEALARTIFADYSVEILREGMIANSVYVTCRITAYLPDGTTRKQDGIGAKGLQLDSGSKPSQLENIKASAVEMALPMALSYAQKDAFEKFGKIFGRDLSRKLQFQVGETFDGETLEQKANEITHFWEEWARFLEEISPEDLAKANEYTAKKGINFNSCNALMEGAIKKGVWKK